MSLCVLKYYYIKILVALFFVIILYSCGNKVNVNDKSNKIIYHQLSKLSVDESLISIREGVPNVTPFWNINSRRFINVPSFDFNLVEGAVNYKFIATDSNEKEYSFLSEKPWDNLKPIWLKLPVGYVDLEVVGIDKNGNLLKQAGTRKFYKAAPFNGPYNKKVMEYDESAKFALKYIFNQKHIQNWETNGTPDTLAYKLYCYPAKIIGAVIESMVLYNKVVDKSNEDAIIIAKNAADFLISISEPKGAPLEYFPPTYLGSSARAGDYKNQFMVIYPAELAQNYLDLYDITNDTNYFDAAIRIANTYSKLQLPSGTWWLKLWQNGKPVKDNLCIPVIVLEFLDRLKTDYALNNYQEIYERALYWIQENPVKTFDWSGQFEDINPTNPYKNLTKHDACSFAIYLFKHSKENSQNIEVAEELLRYSEDQFVVWEKPMPHKYLHAQRWILPCALEQYDYYVPIDASASKMINTYLAAYKATGKKLYIAKALDLANTMTVAQLPKTGRYPTYWEWNDRRSISEGWLNCAVLDIKVMIKIGKELKKGFN